VARDKQCAFKTRLQDYEGKDKPKELAVHREETIREARAPKIGGAKRNHFYVEDISLISLDAPKHARKCKCLSETFKEPPYYTIRLT
jgi:hypothetical protein